MKCNCYQNAGDFVSKSAFQVLVICISVAKDLTTRQCFETGTATATAQSLVSVDVQYVRVKVSNRCVH